jgi:chloride channel protein, CIC family
MRERGDFTADSRLLWLAALGVGIGACGAGLAWALIRLIGLFTNLFYYQRLSSEFRSPAANTLGWLALVVPIGGGLIVGFMARYGSERIRGHGIPEAMEAILIGHSRMQPKIAILKPLSSAISIGSGGPFGAEGPIIMTGGAIGSIVAQVFDMTAAERKTLLVAGAAAGMSATFGTPVAATLIAVELLLFEWKPRSLVPVAVAASVAALLRRLLLGSGALFPVRAHATLPASAYGSSVVIGLAGGVLSVLLTLAVYKAEDAFKRLPFHWMWWPALGGLAVGIGGLIEPHALGVGYDQIGLLLRGNYLPTALFGLILVKGLIWAVSLGSGTSGGVLAPLLLMGGALGGVLGVVLPGGDAALWPLVGMAAVLGGTMRSPFTAAVFALELTQDTAVLPILLVAVVVADALTVLVLKRSILTEKVARRGYQLSREYAVDPLELLTVHEVMTPDVTTVSADTPIDDVLARRSSGENKHQGWPVLGADGELVGMVTRAEMLANRLSRPDKQPDLVRSLIDRRPIVAFASESCRAAAERMAENGVGRLPVLSDEPPHKLIGIVTRSDLLKARAQSAVEEEKREHFLGRVFQATSGSET